MRRLASTWPGRLRQKTETRPPSSSLTPVVFSPLSPTSRLSSYLTELLLDKGYIVPGLKRRASSYNHPRLEHIMDASEWSGSRRRGMAGGAEKKKADTAIGLGPLFVLRRRCGSRASHPAVDATRPLNVQWDCLAHRGAR